MVTIRILYGAIDGARDPLHWAGGNGSTIAALDGSANCGKRAARTRLA
jgi:hypothetical protein